MVLTKKTRERKQDKTRSIYDREQGREEASDGAKYGRDGREEASGPFPPKMEQTDVPKKEGAAAPSVSPLVFWQEMVWSKLEQGKRNE